MAYLIRRFLLKLTVADSILSRLPCLPQLTPRAFYISRKRVVMLQQNIPQPPKLPPTSYLIYFSERVKTLDKDNRNGAELTSEVAEEWNEMNDAQRSVYKDKHADLIEVYNFQLAAYKSKLTEQQRSDFTEAMKNNIRTSEKKKLGKPAHPKNSMMCYFAEQKGKSLKGARVLWRQLDDSQKKVYEEQGRKRQEQYKKDIEAWEEKMIEEKNFHVLRKETIKKLKKDKLIDNDSSNSQ